MNSKTKKKSKSKIIIWSLVGIAAAAMLLYPLFAPKDITGQTITASRGDLTTYYSFSGSVEAKNRETKFADKAMQIDEIKVEEGQLVKKDDVLMTTLYGQEIVAEIDGEVSAIYAEENAQLMPGAKLIEVVDYTDLQISVKVDEYDLVAISKDKESTVTIHALSKDVKGKIEEVSKEGTYMNGVTFFNATIALENDSAIKVGMSAEAKILDKSIKDALLLPVSAISFDANSQAFVNVKADKGTQIVPLELGLTDGINVEILKGISENDSVIIASAKEGGFTPPFGRRMTQGAEESSGGN